MAHREVALRPAGPDDVEPLRAMLADLYEATYGPLLGSEWAMALHERWHVSERLRNQLDQDRCSFLVATDAQTMVGHAFAVATHPPVLFVVRLYVAGSHQGRGIGSRLLEALETRHATANCERLYVVKGNEPALRFYDRRGFTIVGEVEEDGIASWRLERAIVR